MSAAVQTSREAASDGGVALVAIAASFGGIAACREILSRLPRDLPAPLVVLQHRSPRLDVLAGVLRRHSRPPVASVVDGAQPIPGTVHVAAPDRQLRVAPDGRLVYDDGAATPRADVLLASAGAAHRARLVAVVLTGRLDDGARGAIAVKAAGGRVLAQDPATAAAAGMPAAAIATGCVDFVLPPAAIASALITLTMLPAAGDLFRVARPAWARSAA